MAEQHGLAWLGHAGAAKVILSINAQRWQGTEFLRKEVVLVSLMNHFPVISASIHIQCQTFLLLAQMNVQQA